MSQAASIAVLAAELALGQALGWRLARTCGGGPHARGVAGIALIVAAVLVWNVRFAAPAPFLVSQGAAWALFLAAIWLVWPSRRDGRTS